MAARGGHDLGKDLTEGFYHQWVIGQCVPYLRCVNKYRVYGRYTGTAVGKDENLHI